MIRPSTYCCFVFLHELLGLENHLFLRRGDDHVVLAEGDSGTAGIVEAQHHEMIGEDHGLLLTAMAVDDVDKLRDLPLRQELVDQTEIDLWIPRQLLSEKHSARRGVDPQRDGVALFIDSLIAGLDLRMQRDRSGQQRLLDLTDVRKYGALARFAVPHQRQIVEPEHDVLGRHDDRLSVRRPEDVVGRHHQHACLELSLQ